MKLMAGADAKINRRPRATAGSHARRNREPMESRGRASAGTASAAFADLPRVAINHAGTHKSPAAAVPKNAKRHEVRAAMAIASGAATIAPSELPVKRRPKPAERCPGGSAARTECA